MDLLQNITRIQEKLQLLQKQYYALQKENEKLQQQLQQAQQEKTTGIEKINELTRQVELLKVTKTGMSNEDKLAFEKRINTYLKEIDKCIAIMSE
jgi:predicted nuclease with TOPRIM domain